MHHTQHLAIDKIITLKQEVSLSSPELRRLSLMSDCLCRFNIAPSVQDILDKLRNQCLHTSPKKTKARQFLTGPLLSLFTITHLLEDGSRA